MRILFNALTVLFVTVFASATYAETYFVKMLNAASGDSQQTNLFEPAILNVKQGDTVTFLPVDSGHNSASKRGMLPDGAEPWNSPLDEEFSVTLTVLGVYGYVCFPHYEMGMVGLIVVGENTDNIAALKKVRQAGAARKAFRRLLKKIE
ncbi:MAG: pseudoazurin [Halioglobus sp.]|jgi:pseudoazurin